MQEGPGKREETDRRTVPRDKDTSNTKDDSEAPAQAIEIIMIAVMEHKK